MPMRAPSICACGHRVPSGTRCACAVKRAKESEARRPSASARGYDSNWSKASKAFLAMPGHKHCACGCGRPADMVDHIRAPKGDRALFWDRSNWQPFARVCNTRKAIATEGGFGRPTGSQTPGPVQTFGKGPETAWGPQRKVAPNSVSGKIGS